MYNNVPVVGRNWVAGLERKGKFVQNEGTGPKKIFLTDRQKKD